MKSRGGLIASFVFLFLADSVLAQTPQARADSSVTVAPLEYAPSETGRMGAWLVAGPFRHSVDPPSDGLALGRDVTNSADREHRDPRVVASTRGAEEILGPLGVKRADGQFALAAVDLNVHVAGDHTLLLGVDDGVTVFVDGRTVFVRDEARPLRDADDVIPLTLSVGKHHLVLRLHQRTGAWGFRARLMSERWLQPNVTVQLPGAAALARDVANRMVDVRVRHTRNRDSLYPQVTVSFPEGRVLGTPMPVALSLTDPLRDKGRAKFSAMAGDASTDDLSARGLVAALPAVASTNAKITVNVGAVGESVGISKTFSAGATREALTALSQAEAIKREPRSDLARTSYAYARSRLDALVRNGDRDLDAQTSEAKELAAMTRELSTGEGDASEPYRARTGPMRLAYRSAIDGELHEFALYVPASYRAAAPKPYPLVVVLHGMDGYAMSGLQWFFGKDDLLHDSAWEDRHVASLAPLDAFVLAPSGLGNTMYREMGLEDVMDALARVKETYPIDGDRVSITGPSMGGIGTALAALRYPSTFSAAMPLCGYHSLFVRRDIRGQTMRPWESVLAEERSNVFWAENGSNVPMWIVHGTRDLPEDNSNVLIERLTALGFSVKHDHPEMGHDVWKWAYESQKGARWLTSFTRPHSPWNQNRFRTYRTRFGSSGAATITSQERGEAPAELTTWPQGGEVYIRATNVHELALTRSDVQKPVRVRIGSDALAFEAGEELRAHREGERWVKGKDSTPRKSERVTGPIRDVFHEPILFVYGTKDVMHAKVNEDVARAWAAIRPGVTVRYPIMSDEEFFRRAEAIGNDKALFLIGDAAQNEVTARFGDRLPFRVEGQSIVARIGTAGAQRVYDGRDLGVTYVFPNPERADRYVVVVAGTSPRGAWLSTYLPGLLPDFVVYDGGVQKSRDQLLLGRGNVISGGYFDAHWKLGNIVDDKASQTAAPKTERDATPYLP